MKRLAAAGALGALLVVAPATAQMAPGTRSVGMGGGGMVFATGVDAVEWNPANLGWAQGWNLSIGELGVVGASDGATMDEIFTIFGGAEIPFLGTGDLDPATVVAGLPAEGIRFLTVTEGYALNFGAEQAGVPQPGAGLPTLGLAFGPLAFRIRGRAFSEFTLSRELSDLIGNGFDQNNLQNYAVGNTHFRSASLTEYTVSWGGSTGSLSFGVGGRYIQGHGMTDGRFFEPVIDIATQSLTIESVAVQSTSGSGFGVDLGVSLDLPGGFRAAASGTNVFQKMTWDESLVAWTAVYSDADFDGDIGAEELLNRFEDEPVDPNSVSLAVFEAGANLFDGSFFPQTYRAGVGWQAGGTTVEATGIVVSPRGRFSSPWDERISLGVEQKIPLLTARAGYGMARDGLTALTGGVALRLGPAHLEGSLGRFSGDGEAGPWDGVYLSLGLQVKGGGL